VTWGLIISNSITYGSAIAIFIAKQNNP